MIMAKHVLNYTKGPLNRANTLRQNSDWIIEQQNKKEAQYVPLWKDKTLVSGLNSEAGNAKGVILNRNSALPFLNSANEIVFLGLEGDVPFFCIDLSDSESTGVINKIDGQGRFVDLRVAAPLLSTKECTLLSYAKGICYWHKHNMYCGKCGNATSARHGGSMRSCNDNRCAREIFPTISPAVIMLVEKRTREGEAPQCLLGRQENWPKGVYSTLAGFVDISETLEEAVAREVYEEAGIIVDQIEYSASQPWPFPSSLMLGFRAKAVTTEINFDKEEMEDVRWFTKSEVQEIKWPTLKPIEPQRSESIASYLIARWIEDCD